jgi:hypothetical protein
VQARTIHSAALRQIKFFWPRAYNCELPPVSDSRSNNPQIGESTSHRASCLSRKSDREGTTRIKLACHSHYSFCGVAADQVFLASCI